MVEKALREIEKEDKANSENTEDSIVDEIDLSLEELEATIKDQDFEDFETFLEQESEADNYFLSRGDY